MRPTSNAPLAHFLAPSSHTARSMIGREYVIKPAYFAIKMSPASCCVGTIASFSNHLFLGNSGQRNRLCLLGFHMRQADDVGGPRSHAASWRRAITSPHADAGPRAMPYGRRNKSATRGVAERAVHSQARYAALISSGASAAYHVAADFASWRSPPLAVGIWS